MIQETSKQEKLKDSIIIYIISRLQSLTKYDANIGGGCECCGSWVEHKTTKYGDWIKVEDIEALVKELQVNVLLDTVIPSSQQELLDCIQNLMGFNLFQKS